MSGNLGKLRRASVLDTVFNSPTMALLGSAAVYTALLVAPEQAKALSNWGVPYPSFVFRTDCALQGQVADDPSCVGYPPRVNPPYWTPYKRTVWEWDPPANNISSISFEFYFNPTLFTPVAGSAGFLCDFSMGGSCPTDPPGSGTVPIADTLLPYSEIPTTGLATGSQSIVIGTDTVTVNATFSPAVNNGTDVYFFAMDFLPNVDLSRYAIKYSESLLPNPAYYIMSYSCNGGGMDCGSQQYTQSFALVSVPEPSTWALMLFGFGGIGATIRRASRQRGEGGEVTA